MADRTIGEYVDKILEEVKTNGDETIKRKDINDVIVYGLNRIKTLTKKGLEPIMVGGGRFYCFDNTERNRHSGWITYEKIINNPIVPLRLMVKKIRNLCKNDEITPYRYVVLRNSELDRLINGQRLYGKHTFRSLRGAKMYARSNDKAIYILKYEDFSTTKAIAYEKTYYKRVWWGIIKRFPLADDSIKYTDFMR